MLSGGGFHIRDRGCGCLGVLVLSTKRANLLTQFLDRRDQSLASFEFRLERLRSLDHDTRSETQEPMADLSIKCGPSLMTRLLFGLLATQACNLVFKVGGIVTALVHAQRFLQFANSADGGEDEAMSLAFCILQLRPLKPRLMGQSGHAAPRHASAMRAFRHSWKASRSVVGATLLSATIFAAG